MSAKKQRTPQTPENRRRQLAGLVPFKKGAEWKGHAGGIPKGYKPISKALKRVLAQKWKCDPDTGEQLNVSDLLATALVNGGKKRAGFLPFIQEIIRATEGSKVKIEGGEEVGSMAGLSVADLLKARAGILRQRQAEDDESE